MELCFITKKKKKNLQLELEMIIKQLFSQENGAVLFVLAKNKTKDFIYI